MRKRKLYVTGALVLILMGVLGLVAGLIILERNKNDDEDKITGMDDFPSMDVIIDASQVDIEAVKIHNKQDDCWIVYDQSVFDISGRLSEFTSFREADCGSKIEGELSESQLETLAPYSIAGFEDQKDE